MQKLFPVNTFISSKCEVSLSKPSCHGENECEKAHGMQFKEASKQIMTRSIKPWQLTFTG